MTERRKKSARLAMKTKFINTSDTPLVLDDEDTSTVMKGKKILTEKPTDDENKEQRTKRKNDAPTATDKGKNIAFEENIHDERREKRTKATNDQPQKTETGQKNDSRGLLYDARKEYRTKGKNDVPHFTLIDIPSNSPTGKGIKRKAKKLDVNEEEEEVKIVKKDLIIKQLPVLKSRMSPGSMYDVVKSLTQCQRNLVKDMGFGALLDMELHEIPATRLQHYVVSRYKPLTNSIQLRNGSLQITEQTIKDMLGIPLGGINIDDLEDCGEDDPLHLAWKAQFPLDKNDRHKFNTKTYVKLIRKSDIVDDIFKLNFLCLFINTFCESELMGTRNIKYIKKLARFQYISEIDWCRYMFNCLEKTWYKWKPNKVVYYSGPLTLLMLTYADRVEFEGIRIHRCRPFIKSVTPEDFRQIEEFEIESGRFGRGRIRSEHQGIKQGFNATIENDFNKMIEMKRSLEETIIEASRRFPYNAEIRNWRFQAICLLSGTCLSNRAMSTSSETTGENRTRDTFHTPVAKRTNSVQTDAECEEDIHRKGVKESQPSTIILGGSSSLPASSPNIQTPVTVRMYAKQAAAASSLPVGTPSFQTPITVRMYAKPQAGTGTTPAVTSSSKPQTVVTSNPVILQSIGTYSTIPTGTSSVKAPSFASNPTTAHNVGEPTNQKNVEKGTSSRMVADSIPGNPDIGMISSPGIAADITGTTSKKHLAVEVPSKTADENPIDFSTPISSVKASGPSSHKQPETFKITYSRKTAMKLKSPYERRLVNMNHETSKDEEILAKFVFTSTKEDEDTIWETDAGYELFLGAAKTFQTGVQIEKNVIDCWSHFMNKMEVHKASSSESRLFFPCDVLNEAMMDETKPEIIRYKSFEMHLKLTLDEVSYKSTLEDVDLVFFPIVDKDHYYLMVFSLKRGNFYIFDNQKTKETLENTYGRRPRILKNLFCHYLETVGHPKRSKLVDKDPVSVKMKWQTTKKNTDGGIFLMRHMESYVGEPVNIWSCGLEKETEEQISCLQKLRLKYLSKMLLSEFNIIKSYIENEVYAFKNNQDNQLGS